MDYDDYEDHIDDYIDDYYEDPDQHDFDPTEEGGDAPPDEEDPAPPPPGSWAEHDALAARIVGIAEGLVSPEVLAEIDINDLLWGPVPSTEELAALRAEYLRQAEALQRNKRARQHRTRSTKKSRAEKESH